ncbi:MAG: BREX system ATP-binding domain-containing protein [Acidimicrobiales bacterium]
MIAVDDYAEFLAAEYLESYVADGGAAVKFVVAGEAGEADRFSNTVRDRAAARGYATVRVDAVDVRAHMMDQVFFAVAGQVDWEGLAAHRVRAAFAAVAHPVPEGAGDISVEALAAWHQVEPAELTRDVNRQLQHDVFHDYAMVQEFRIAMLRLCQAQLRTGQVTEAEHAAVLDWLRGELRQISVLRSAMIFRRIGRHNARQLLFSLAHWLAVNDQAGLFVEVDVRRFGFARRPQPDERHGLYYTKAALLDGYELLRQLVDNTDELSHCCVVVVAGPEFTSDANRGLDAYQALKLRIYDDVRDRNRDNPYSSLIRLGAA